MTALQSSTLGSRTLLFVILLALFPRAFAADQAPVSDNHTAGSTGYQANVPPVASNLLANAGVTLNASAAPNADAGTAPINYTKLTDGSFGTVPNTGGGGPNAAGINSNTILTYTIPSGSGYDVSTIDVFTSWGDNGRCQSRVAVSYSTIADPITFLPIATVNYNPGGVNSTWVRITNVNAFNVGAIRFTFPAQQNGYVGYCELAAGGTLSAAGPSASTWVGAVSSDWGNDNNWNPVGVPPPANVVVFGSAASNPVVDLGTSSRTAVGITFLADVSTTIGSTLGNSITLDNGAAFSLVGVAGSHTVNTALSLNSNLTLNCATGSQLAINGIVSEIVAAKSLSLAGTGTLLLSAINSYTGGSALAGGILNFREGSLGITGNITFSGGLLRYNSATVTPDDFGARFKLSSGAIRVDVNGLAVTYAGIIDASNVAGLTLSTTLPNGSLTLSGTNAFTGTASVLAGTLKAGSATAFNNTNSLSLSANAVFDLNGFNAAFTNFPTSALTSSVTNNGAAPARLTVNVLNATINALITDGTQPLGVSVGNANAGFPTFPPTNANTFSSGLTLLHNAAGTRLRISAITATVGTPGAIVSSPFGRGPITVGTTKTSKAQILIDVAANQTLIQDLIINTSLGTDAIGGIRVDTAGNVFSGTITANLSDASFITGPGGSFSLTGQVTGPSGLRLHPGATVTATLNNATINPNNYQGPTTVGTGTRLILGAANQIPDGAGTGDTAVNGSLELNGFSESLNGLSGEGTVDGISGTPTLTVGNNGATSSFGGTIQNTAGVLSLVKAGIGTLTLSKPSTYSGATTIVGGTVQLAPTNTISIANFNSDATSGIDGTLNTYTHLLDFQGTADTVVNNANFTATNTARSGPDWTLAGVPGNYPVPPSAANFPAGFAPATGGLFTVLRDFYFGAGTAPGPTGVNGELSLTGLIPGARYSARLYYRSFGIPSKRICDFTCSNGLSSTLITVNEDVDAIGHYIDYQYTAGPTGTASISETNNVATADNSSWHWYAFSNQSLPATTVADILPVATSVTLGVGAQLRLSLVNQTLQSVTGDASSTIALGTSTLTLGDATPSVTFAGAITGSGTGNLVKQGTGTLVLSGVSAHSGAITVGSGTLLLDPSGFIGLSTTMIATGATLAGTGTAGAIIVNGTVSPGDPAVNSGVGTLPVSSATFNVSGQFLVDVTSTSAASADQLDLSNGALVVQSGAKLTVRTPVFAPSSIEYIVGKYGSSSGSSAFVVDNSLNNTGTNATVGYVFGTPNEIHLKFGTGVTPVTLEAFTAQTEGAGTLISWTAISEFQNVGFNVYRRSLSNSDWLKINPVLIPGRLTNAEAKIYRLVDWSLPGEYLYKLESVSLTGVHESHRELAGPLTVDPLLSANQVSAAGIDAACVSIANGENARQTQLLSAKHTSVRESVSLAGAQQASTRGVVKELNATLDQSASAREAAQSVVASAGSNAFAGVRWFSNTRTSSAGFSAAKVTTQKSGVHLIPQSALPAGLDLSHVTLQREGRNFNALALTPNGMLFYTPGYSDEYTNKDAMFLRRSTSPTPAGKITSASNLFNSAVTPSVTTAATVTNDYHDVYFDYSLRPYNFAPWFSDKYLTQGSTQNFTISTPVSTAGAATLTLNLWSLTASSTLNPDHALRVLINGQFVGETSWDGGERMLQLSFTVPAGVLSSATNTVSLVTPSLAGQDSQIAFVHSISVGYTRLLNASKPLEVVNSSSSAQLIEAYNLPSANAWVVDTRFTDRATLVPTETQRVADGTYRLRFMATSGGSGKFLIVPAGQEHSAVSISPSTVKALRLNGTYLATGPIQFANALQPLLTARSREGVRATFVDQEQLFDYYNHGRYGPAGIRNAVRATRPRYLLLAGRTTHDYLNYSGASVDPMCPTFLVPTSFWAQATSDSMFGDLGRGYPEVAVGRIPVNTPAEMRVAVNRILGYTGFAASGPRVHAVADAADSAGDFAQQLGSIESAHPDLNWQQNYLGTTHESAAQVNAAMTEAANGGADLILYSGHGNAARLGKNAPHILDNNLVGNWIGNTVFLQSTCTANWMAKNEDGYKSIAIQALTQPQGGISASIASSTYMDSECSTQFMNKLLKNSQSSPSMRWGNALMQTQQWAHQQNGANSYFGDLSRTEQIFGDPAMRVFAPTTTLIGGSQNSSRTGTF